MLAPGPTHYEVLGLPESASREAIRRRFRELARELHPDVAVTEQTGARFRQVNEAHRVLSDSDRRKAYDAELKLAAVRRAVRPAQAKPPPKPAEPATGSAKGAAAAAKAYREQQPASLVDQIVAEARSSLARMKLREAELYCKEALGRDRKCSAAYEILGDIHRARGRADEAIAMYSYVLQLDRRNREVQEKFDRLNLSARKPGVARAAARAYSSASQGRARSVKKWHGGVRQAALVACGVTALSFLVVSSASLESGAAGSLLPIEWDPRLLTSLFLAGAAAGLLLGSSGALEPLREELLLRPRGARGRAAPFGTALVLLSMVWAFAALLLLMTVSIVNEARSRSLGRAFAAAFAVVLAFAAARSAEFASLGLMGGNLVFPGLVAGWGMADAVRRGRR